MNLEVYDAQFEDILEGRNVLPPYDSPDYVHYVKTVSYTHLTLPTIYSV